MNPNDQAPQQPVQTPVTPQFSSPQPNYSPEPPSQNLTTLAAIGLFLCFIFMPIGLIISIIVLRKKPTGTARTLALIGTILSSIAIVVGILAIILISLATNKAASNLQTDMNNFQSSNNLTEIKDALEGYYSTSISTLDPNSTSTTFMGTYPTLAQINNVSWRTQNLENNDKSMDTMFSPSGNANGQLVSGNPTSSVFAYNPIPVGCAGTVQSPCTSYTLSGIVSGKVKTLKSLN